MAEDASSPGIRKALENKLKDSLTDDEWSWLVDEKYISQALAGDLKVDELVMKVRLLRRVWGNRNRPVNPAKQAPQMLERDVADRADELTRIQVLSVWLANQATQLPQVAAYRRKVLEGHLLRPDEIKAWVESQRKGRG